MKLQLILTCIQEKESDIVFKNKKLTIAVLLFFKRIFQGLLNHIDSLGCSGFATCVVVLVYGMKQKSKSSVHPMRHHLSGCLHRTLVTDDYLDQMLTKFLLPE